MSDEDKIQNQNKKLDLKAKSEKLENESSEDTTYISNIAKLFAIGVAALMIVGAFFAMSNSGIINTDFINDESKNIVLSNDTMGSVIKKGPYGNLSSDIRIAYIIGVHPKEYELHDNFEKLFNKKEDHLNYCYYVYKIEVNPSIDEYEEGRMAGQKLAAKYVVPDIINNKFNFATDIHYNIGSWGYANFVFVPETSNNDTKNMYAKNIANNFVERYDWASYYLPNDPTSPQYVTTPLNEAGVPSMLYEGYAYEEEEIVLNHLNDLIDWIDNYPFQ